VIYVASKHGESRRIFYVFTTFTCASTQGAGAGEPRLSLRSRPRTRDTTPYGKRFRRMRRAFRVIGDPTAGYAIIVATACSTSVLSLAPKPDEERDNKREG
jgi:hypothetical protein